jgi:ABC-type branched-subunit amino acid transport system substrate-binding protein
MAVADLGDTKIDLRVYDTTGTAEIASQQAQKAVDDGAKIILGPLYAEAANAAAVMVADDGVNVISFSNNPTIAGANLFILGKTFDNTAKRIVDFAASQGKTRAVVVYPNNVEGSFGLAAIEQAAKNTNLEIVSAQGFEFTQDGVVNAVPLIKAAVDIESADLILLTSTSVGALPLLAQLLPEAGIDPSIIQYAGLARWDIPPQTLELKGLQGGWFTMPDFARTEEFSNRYQETFGARPHQLASLAYDGIAALGVLIESGKSDAFSAQNLTQAAGFQGVDGIFRLKSDGTNERGLTIAKVQDKQVLIIDPAPRAFAIGGF